MLTVHHLENSRSQRILWLLEELSVDYEIKFYLRDKKTSLNPFLGRPCSANVTRIRMLLQHLE